MLIEKKKFTLDSYAFELSHRKIPVTIGYETYGKLNSKRDNVILLCHYFTGTSHAAGRYTPEDPAPGWWDTLIGPNKAIDTNHFFVISSDSLANINFHNPNVITTGPASINPETGREYGMDFPIFTLRDNVRIQKKLLESLGIEKLHAVAGPSMGGLQAFMWGRQFPELVTRILTVVATPMVAPFVVMIPNQLGIEAIKLDPHWQNGNYYGHKPPQDGLLAAFKILLMGTRTDDWADRNFGRRLPEGAGSTVPEPRRNFFGKFLVETEVEKTVLERMKFFDANSYMYIAKANALYDLCENGESEEQAWRKIIAKTLMVIDESDLLFTRRQAQKALPYLPDAHTFYYNSGNGHLSCLFDIPLIEPAVKSFFA
jgi:homoserine O-acetyltransferase